MDFTDEEYEILDRVSRDINNIQLLDRISKEKLKILKSTENSSCNNYIFNVYLNQPRFRLDSISVPIFKYTKMYNRKYNIVVYMFGEKHDAFPCENTLKDKIYDNFKNCPYMIDVFTEYHRKDVITYKYPDINVPSINVNDVYKFHQQSKNNYINIRTHEVDYRSYDGKDIYYKTMFDEHVDFLQFLQLEEDISDHVKEKTYKQISNMYDEEYKTIVKEWFEKAIEDVKKSRRFLKNIAESGNEPSSITKKIRDNLIFNVGLINYNTMTSVLDSYLVARMHRTFNKKVEDKFNCSNIVQNAVILAGYVHIRMMIHILTKLGYELIVDVYNNDKCMQLQEDNYMFYRPL